MPTILLIWSILSSLDISCRSKKYVPHIFLRKLQPINQSQKPQPAFFSRRGVIRSYQPLRVFISVNIVYFKPNDYNLQIIINIYSYLFMRQEGQQLRDITIIYKDIKILIKVPANKIVSQFFRYEWKTINEYLKAKAQQQNITPFINLPQQQKYDVTLNSLNIMQSSVMNSGISFGSYDKKKNLRFYIHSLDAQNEFQILNQKNIVLCLIRGNVTEKQLSFDASKMNYQQFQSKVRQTFSLDPLMRIKFKNMKDNTFINLNNDKEPASTFKQLRITKIGIYPIYEAGGL